jgi:hypothetical protein
MGIVSVFYAAFGHLTLLAAILWGMLFVGDGVIGSLMDAPATVPPLEAILVDLGLLLPLALLHRLTGRGMLRHITKWSIPRGLAGASQAWAAALGLVVLYAAWQPLPQRIWNFTGPLEWAILALFYFAWTLVLIGAFLPGQTAGGTAPPDTLRVPLCKPLYGGILLAMWATSTVTVGHLLLATTVTGYLLFDSVLEARKTRGTRETHGAYSFQGKRVTG